MELSEKLKGYLVNRLMDDLESARDSYQKLVGDYEGKVVEISFIKDNLKMKEIENVEKSATIEDLEKIAANYEKLYASYKELDEKSCELKKENVRLKEKEVKVIPLLEAENKREEYIKELENKIKLFEEDNNILNDKIKDLEQELLKKVIIECEPKKRGRKPKVAE